MSRELTAADLAEIGRISDRLHELLLDVVLPAREAAAVTPAPPATRALTQDDIEDAAQALNVAVAKIKAVREVESGRLGGFGPDGRPIILFEPHVFSRLTQHRYDGTHGGVSYPTWGAKPYPASQVDRWAQLEYAEHLDRDAALQSASFGLFQIMGFNWKVCGFASVDGFYDAMCRNEREHLMAFVNFLKANHLDQKLAAGDWLGLATGYNGPGQAQAYAAKLSAAYAKWSAQ